MRYPDGTYDLPVRPRLRHSVVEEVELGFRVADLWLEGLENEGDVRFWAEIARFQAMMKL